MQESSSMAIEDVVIAVAKIALVGKFRLIHSRCIYFNQHLESNPSYIEVNRLMHALDAGEVVRTTHEDIQDTLAHARQIAAIPAETWDRVLKIHPAAE